MIGKMRSCIYLILILIPVLIQVSCGDQLRKEDAEEQHKHTNSLINETSPYLLQHAHNPVDWMPWGTAAFEKAKAENKLVLISVGYSSCHWCHVMEEESFEDEEVAALMNEKFICIKVDREERPDVDQVYMDAVQFMTNGNGGWPLNCFTLPDGRPIKGGTYFQRDQWVDLLNNLEYNYRKSPQQFEQYATNVQQRIEQAELIESQVESAAITLSDIDTMVLKWATRFDTVLGGELAEQKFPMPSKLNFLMEYAYSSNDTILMKQVDLTLKKMALGGIFDQIGGGFSRYSTDPNWKVPHFEKMLYDNAQLISLYSKAYQRSKDPLYKAIVYGTVQWAFREMYNGKGGFYSALDADSDGEEGKFYVWSDAELKDLLNQSDYELAKSYFDIGEQTAWEGNHILQPNLPIALYAEQNRLDIAETTASITRIKETLLAERNKRTKPGRDDKSLTSWNALMIVGLVDAYFAFNEPKFLQAAKLTADWISRYQFQTDGRLWHSYINGEASIHGFLEDYSFTIEAFIRLYQATFDERYLDKSTQLANYAIQHFYDEQKGLFYFTESSENALIQRKIERSDQAIPSSNAVMANGLYDLGIILDNSEYKKQAKQMLSKLTNDIKAYPGHFSNWSKLALHLNQPYFEVAITGENWRELQVGLNEVYAPNRLYMGASESSDLAILEGKFIGETTIFVCIEGSCRMPTDDVSTALKEMGF